MPLARLIPFRRRIRPFDLNGMGGWEMFDRDFDRLFDRYFLAAYEHRTPDRKEIPGAKDQS